MNLADLKAKLVKHYSEEAARAEAAAKAKAEAEAEAAVKAKREAEINAKAAELSEVFDIGINAGKPMPVELFRVVFGTFLEIIEARHGLTAGNRKLLENSVEGFELMKAALGGEFLQDLELTKPTMVVRHSYQRPQPQAAPKLKKHEPDPIKYDLPPGAVDLTEEVCK